MANSSVQVAVAYAVSFMTRPLHGAYSPDVVGKCQLVLEANLTALYAPSWNPAEPQSGSGRRCLTLSPSCIPPRAVYAACAASTVQWFHWIKLLGNAEFDLFVDPCSVTMRLRADPARPITIWADELPYSRQTFDDSSIKAAIKRRAKTLAQQLIEHDRNGDDEIFSMIAEEVNTPSWISQIPRSRSTSPLSTISSSSSTASSHSRCSSRSSNSSFGSVTEKSKPSRRERAKHAARVFVDSSKKEVTPYDGGKTTVLTGGVMLGAGPKRPTSQNWRSASA